MFSPDDVSDLIEEFGLARGNSGSYGGGHARYPPYRIRQCKRIIRPNYSPFAKKLPNNSAYFSLDLLTFMTSQAAVAFICIATLAQAQDSRSTPIETQTKLLMHGRELMTADIAQAREMSLYDDGGHFDCREHSFSDTSPRNCDLPKVRDFIWEHWQKKRRGYIRVTVDSVDTMSTSHIFVEPDKKGVWHISWRIAQARSNGPSVVRDLSPLTTVERVDSKLAFKGTDGSETHL